MSGGSGGGPGRIETGGALRATILWSSACTPRLLRRLHRLGLQFQRRCSDIVYRTRCAAQTSSPSPPLEAERQLRSPCQ